jgi:hypothetical protein
MEAIRRYHFRYFRATFLSFYAHFAQQRVMEKKELWHFCSVELDDAYLLFLPSEKNTG